MSIEYQTSCATTFTNNVIQNENTTVCVWQNALMQPCFPGGSTASLDQQWVYDNSTGGRLAFLVPPDGDTQTSL